MPQKMSSFRKHQQLSADRSGYGRPSQRDSFRGKPKPWTKGPCGTKIRQDDESGHWLVMCPVTKLRVEAVTVPLGVGRLRDLIRKEERRNQAW